MKLNQVKIVLYTLILLSLYKFGIAAENIPTQKSSIILSGTFYSQFRQMESVDLWRSSISTSSGYFALNNLSIHLLLGLTYSRFLSLDFEDPDALDFIIGGESRYYFNKFNPYIFSSIAITHHVNDEYSSKYSFQQYQYSLGCNLFVTKHVSIEPSIYYMRQDPSYRYFGMKAGIGTFLFK